MRPSLYLFWVPWQHLTHIHQKEINMLNLYWLRVGGLRLWAYRSTLRAWYQ